MSNGAPGHDIYTKAGKIRKDCSVQRLDVTAEEMKDYLDRTKFVVTGKPYVFTHIEGLDSFGCRCIIKQEIMGLICSPTKLGELLGI